MVVVGVDNNNNNNNNKWSKQSFIIYKRLTMPKIVNGKKIYSAAEKAAYYKAKAQQRSAPVRRAPRSKSSYLNTNNRYVRNWNKPYKYPGVGGAVGGTIGHVAGTTLGGPVGGMVGHVAGKVIGNAAHALVKTVTGFGDYKISKNSLMYNKDSVPLFNVRDRVTHVRHREFVGDIRGSTNFVGQRYDINPSNPSLFPWLSAIAANYEQWICQGLLFEFKTTSATAVSSTNTALGTVVLATQYNTLAPPFTNKAQMENYEFCQSTVPCESVIHPIECDPKQTANNGLFYTEDIGYNSNADPRLYNIGTFTIATVGMQAAATVGELWVTYDICFLKPRLQGNVSVGDHWIIAPATIGAALPFGTNPQLSSSSTSYVNAGTSEAVTALITSPWSGVVNNQYLYINPNYVGNLILIYSVIAPAGVAYQDPLLNLFGNITLNSIYYSVNQKSYAAAGNTQIQVTACINCTGGVNGVIYPYIQFSGGALPAGTATDADLTILSVPSNLIN